MEDQGLNLAHAVHSACVAEQSAIAAALHRAFETDFEIQVGEPTAVALESLPESWNKPGLVFIFKHGDQGVLGILPDADEVLPSWSSTPDALQQDRLRSLASDLGNVLLPGTSVAPESTVARVPSPLNTLRDVEVSPTALKIPITIRSGDTPGELVLICRATQMTNPFEADAEQTSEEENSSTSADASSKNGTSRRTRYADLEDGLGLLPSYSRSLLKIKVPVTVTLAQARQPLNSILNIGSGSIIHFNKSCDDTLTLEVAGHKIAVGETVKVGDKFGLWITSMILPDERFWVISNHPPLKRAR